MRPDRGSKEAVAEHRRILRSTGTIVNRLKDIRKMANDAAHFIPGHQIKPEYRAQLETELAGIVATMEKIGLRDYCQEYVA